MIFARPRDPSVRVRRGRGRGFAVPSDLRTATRAGIRAADCSLCTVMFGDC